MPRKEIIRLSGINAGPANNTKLHNITWSIYRNEHWAITGSNGSGKTLLARTLMGNCRVHSGSIQYLFLKDPNSVSERKQAMEMISFTDTGRLFRPVETQHYYQQRYNAFDSSGHYTAYDYLLQNGYDVRNSRHGDLVERLGLSNLLNLDLIKLSSGQTRKLLLCKALLKTPRILILDNAHIGLDQRARETLNEIIDDLITHYEITVVMSGQFISLPRSIENELQLRDGKIFSINRRYSHKTPPYDRPVNIRSSALLKMKNTFSRPFGENSFREVLSLTNIHIKYDRRVILDGFDWKVRKGEKWALLGDNGSGKSTILSLVYGDHPQAYANQIILFDQKRGSGESIWDIKKRIGFTSPELHSYFTYNFSAINIVLSGIWDGFYVKKADPKYMEIARDLFSYFSLSDKMEEPFHSLSTGTQRILLFMRALIKVPPVLLLDEPYQGLDPKKVDQCNTLLDHILTEQYSMIFISHFSHEIPNIADRRKILKRY